MPIFNRKKKVTSEELGQGLWLFCKKLSREFYASFSETLEKQGFELNEDQKFSLAREIAIMNLWIISKALGEDRKALEELHRIYIFGHENFAETEDQKIAFPIEAKKELHERYKKYYDAWDDKAGGNQWILALTMLECILNEGNPSKKLINAELNFLLLTDVLLTMKAVLDFRAGYEVAD
ncbi:hypothetical protein A3A74_08140 [Candidatus Roizmanbacteria bacterium RIFCSPLOWO2_01_FULL_35_13]|uniref:Uncharacterized protein n=1 Tax=Candidatus Roizmanbacteria bacterium RIFCSPLOWO2_01_FULL_35_13 TaxID=1802055 RepID=A0A1F7IDZ3_9BACT|nr:MAG: hypothetical protein A3A74_08140 [Candidatus Roizmanbacteria bacterium RIFCSPLOWO2_01_FULL_35_13]